MLSPKNETEGFGMKIETPGEQAMGGVHKGGHMEKTPAALDAHIGNRGMGPAVAMLNKDLERVAQVAKSSGDATPSHTGAVYHETDKHSG